MNIQDVRCFLLDMDGTFYLGENLIPGSLDFIRRVEETGRDFLFLTNNSSHNAEFYVQRLKRMGLNVGREKVLTSGEATAAVLKEKYPGKRAFSLQFHPEAHGGPLDCGGMFARFVAMMEGKADA